MKAKVQYDDFTGTSAADISDHTNLNKFLGSRGVNTDRYVAIGASFYAWYDDFFSPSIICIDKEQSNEEKKHIVKIGFESGFNKQEFFGLFKRFEVIICEKYGGYDDQEIDGHITVEDSPEEN